MGSPFYTTMRILLSREKLYLMHQVQVHLLQIALERKERRSTVGTNIAESITAQTMIEREIGGVEADTEIVMMTGKAREDLRVTGIRVVVAAREGARTDIVGVEVGAQGEVGAVKVTKLIHSGEY